MKTPREIYAAYNIMPALQLHQLRVAAVAQLICDTFQKPVNAHNVILACLFHDMGNILKFDLARFPAFTAPRGVEYWESVKTEYKKKYGSDEHAATQAIMEELGFSKDEDVRELMRGVGLSRVTDVAADDSFERKIVQYSDLRVGPHGVLTLNDRIDEGRERYRGSGRSIGTEDESRFKTLVDASRAIERQIFAHTSIKPEDITDAAIAPLVETLGEYPVS